MGPRNNIRLGGCQITVWLLAYFNMVTVPHKMVDYRECRITEVSDKRGFAAVFYWWQRLYEYEYSTKEESKAFYEFLQTL